MAYTKAQYQQIAGVLSAVIALFTTNNVRRARGVAAITRESGDKWVPPSGESFHNANRGDVADFWSQVQSRKIVAISPYGALTMTALAQGVDAKMVKDFLKSFIVPPFDNIGDYNEKTDSDADVMAVLTRAYNNAKSGYDPVVAERTLRATAGFWAAR